MLAAHSVTASPREQGMCCIADPQVSVPCDAASPLLKERMVRTVPRNRGSGLAALIADFCNKIGTLPPNARTLLHPQLAIGDRGKFGKPSGFVRCC
jgi:hypothetical protein